MKKVHPTSSASSIMAPTHALLSSATGKPLHTTKKQLSQNDMT
jgi:hypothetical protein